MASGVSLATLPVAVLTCIVTATACVPTQWKDHHEDQHAGHIQRHVELQRRYSSGLIASIDELEDQYYAAQVSATLDRRRHDLNSWLKTHESSLYSEVIVQMLTCTVANKDALEHLNTIRKLEEKLASVHRDSMEGVGSVSEEHRIIISIGSAQRQYVATLTEAQRTCWKEKRELLHASIMKLRGAAKREEGTFVEKAKDLVMTRSRRLEADRWRQETVKACAMYSASGPEAKSALESCGDRLRERFQRHIEELEGAFREVHVHAMKALELKFERALTNLRGGKTSDGK